MDDIRQTNVSLGLVANGSSKDWDVSVLESLDQPLWYLEIESPRIYLVFRLMDLAKIGRALTFLRNGLQDTHDHYESASELVLQLGWLDAFPVNLIWDDENSKRCFFVIGSPNPSTLRISLVEDEVRMVVEALQQIEDELANETECAMTSAQTQIH